MNDQIVMDFNNWVDRILSEHPIKVAAYNFNLYEHDRSFAIQLVGAARFDGDDPSWACDEAFSSGEDLFAIPHELAGSDWQDGLATAKQLIMNYIHSGGAQREKLQVVQGIGVGFVDGDLELLTANQDQVIKRLRDLYE
jgi:hypothetical protein